MWNGLSNLRNLWFGASYMDKYNRHIIKCHSKIMIYGKEEISKADIGIISNDSFKYSKTIYAQRGILELRKPTYQ